MICKVISAIEKYNMPLCGKKVVVGVSGGADSMALLNVMCRLKDKYSFDIIACHVNHCIRGIDADNDEKHVFSYCKKNNIAFKSIKIDVPNLSKKYGMSEEEYGRKARYEFFNSMGRDVVIATAHTLSDRCETLLFNLARGTSTSGLSSIPAVRDNIIRPLIECTREDVEIYCRENEIEYVTDKTNYDDAYSRNRIRLNVIPQLKKLNPSFETAVERLINSCENDNDYFNKIVNDIIVASKQENGYRVDLFLDEHTAVRLRVIARLIKDEIGIYPESVHIKCVDEILNGGKTEIIGDNFVVVKDGILSVNPEMDEYTEWSCDFSAFSAETPTGKFLGEILNKNELSGSQFVHKRMLDYDKTMGALTLRNRRAGDTIKLAGSKCTKKLKNLFNEKKTVNRNNTPVLADECGIVWIMGIGCSDRCKITDETKRVLLIREENTDD